MGVGFAFSGRQGWIRTVLTAVGVGLGVAMLLLAASVPEMMSARETRTDARAINGSVAGNVTGQEDAKATDRTLLSADANTEYHGLDLYGRTLQADGDHPVTPPGTDRIPGPGEALVSPELKKLLDSDEGAELKKRLDARIVGTIGDDGLIGPTDLAFYLGSDTLTAADTDRVSYFGNVQSKSPVDPLLVLLGAVACAVMLMPVAVFIGTATRFGGERRDRRLAALRLVGADSAMTRRVAAGESLAGAVLGLLFGGAVFLLARELVAGVELFRLSVFAEDVMPSPLLGVLVLVGVPVMAVAASVFALRGVAIEPLGVVRESTPRPRRLWWRLIVPVVGLALLLPLAGKLAGGGGGGGEVNEFQVVSGVILLLSGVAVLLPWLVERLVARLGGGSVSWQLAVRRLQLSSGAATRAVSGITIAVAGAIALQLLFAGVEAEATTSTGRSASDRQINVIGHLEKDPGEAARATRELKDTKGVTSATGYAKGTQSVKGDPEGYGEVIVADCATLREVARIGSCREGQVFRAASADGGDEDEEGAPPEPGSVLEVKGPGGHGESTWRVPAGTRTVAPKLKAWDFPVTGILATPSAVSADRLDAEYNAWVNTTRDDPEALEHVRTTAYLHDPAFQVMEGREERTSAGFVELSRGIFAGASAVMLLIAASMVVSQLEQLRERKRQLAVLVAFGTRRSTLSASVLWQSAVPVLLGLSLASVAGLGLGWALLKVIGRPLGDLSVIWPLLGVGGGLIALVTLLSMPALWRLMRPGGLRME